MHVPSTLESVAELKYLTSVPTQIVSPQASKPVMGLVQDSLLGIYLLSQCTKITLEEMMRLICSTSNYSENLPAHLPNNPRWTAQQLMSMFLPQIAYKKGNVEIMGGQMLSGILDSTTVGKKNNSLFHITWNDFGPNATKDLFNNLSFTANTWLQMQGFSCGISDCIIPTSELDKVQALIKQYKGTASDTIQNAKLGEIPKGNDPYTYKRDFPKNMIVLMNKCRKEIEELTEKNISSTNQIGVMVTCGSKGNKTNISNIMSMVGQQEIEGNWIENQLYRRTMPHFYKDDLRPESHGFIENSFMTGFNPIEYFYHAQEGRIGIITKAIKTAETGYIQRKLVKIMEDLRICYDGTVRNANNMLIQTVYGNDGFDACYMESQNMYFINYNMDRMVSKFKHLENDDERLKASLTPEAYRSFHQQGGYTQIENEFKQILDYHKYLKINVPASYVEPDVKAPINFKRMILNTSNRFNLSQEVIADLDPIYVANQVAGLREKMVVDPIESINYVSTILMNSLMAIYLSSKVLIYEYKFNRVAFDSLIETVYATFLKSLVNPGDNVGIQGAQSLGEPTTQMALNTFHYTGQGSKANIARGTPRLKELLGLSRKPKTPSMSIHIYQDYFDQRASHLSKEINSDRLGKIGADIEYTILRDLLVRTEIYYDDNDFVTCVSDDQEFIDSYYDLLPEEERDTANYRWLIRMEFDREMIMRKHIPMYVIENCLTKELGDSGRKIMNKVIVSDDNAQKLICRIKIEKSDVDDPINYLRELETKLLATEIKGIAGVDKCLPNTYKKEISLPNGVIVSPYDSKELYEDATKNYNNLRYILETNGTNLIKVLCLPNIDIYKTVSNDVWEIYELYGVEAARKCIITEIAQLLEYNETYIQERHISLLVDVMTNQGTLVSVDRHGVNKTDSGPLHRASFEETTAQLTNASIFNEVDNMTGVSGNIMFGQFIPTGTNSFKIALDVEKIKKQVIPKQDLAKPKTDIAVTEEVDLTDFCSDEALDFVFKLNR